MAASERSRRHPQRKRVFEGTTGNPAPGRSRLRSSTSSAQKRFRQLSAEFRIAFKTDEPWWLDAGVEAIADAEQDKWREPEGWEEPIARFASAQMPTIRVNAGFPLREAASQRDNRQSTKAFL